MHRPVIAHRAIEPQVPSRRALRDLAFTLVGIAAIVGMLLTTSGSLRFLG